MHSETLVSPVCNEMNELSADRLGLGGWKPTGAPALLQQGDGTRYKKQHDLDAILKLLVKRVVPAAASIVVVNGVCKRVTRRFRQ